MKKEYYIMIDGKKIDLTEEQIKTLGLETEEKKDYFERGSQYYFISTDMGGAICYTKDTGRMAEDKRYRTANYCTNRELMVQRALHETLNRLLWRFSMQNDGDKIDWSNNNNEKYHITYNHSKKQYNIDFDYCVQQTETIYFYKEEIAQGAINEIVIPFIEEHPKFVW